MISQEGELIQSSPALQQWLTSSVLRAFNQPRVLTTYPAAGIPLTTAGSPDKLFNLTGSLPTASPGVDSGSAMRHSLPAELGPRPASPGVNSGSAMGHALPAELAAEGGAGDLLVTEGHHLGQLGDEEGGRAGRAGRGAGRGGGPLPPPLGRRTSLQDSTRAVQTQERVQLHKRQHLHSEVRAGHSMVAAQVNGTRFLEPLGY